MENLRNVARLFALVEIISEPVMGLSETSTINFVNDAFLALTGYSESELIGAHISLIQDSHSPTHAVPFPSHTTGGPPSSVPLKMKSGSIVMVSVIVGEAPLPDGEVVRISTVIPVSE